MRNGTKEKSVQMLRPRSTEPITFAPPASTASERIHFHDRRKTSSGNNSAAAPKAWKKRSARYAPGYPMRLRGRAPEAASQDGSWAWYDTRLKSVTNPVDRSRNPVISFSLLCCVGDRSFITLAGG